MNQKQREAQEAQEFLREMLKPGDTVYTIVRHTSRSGMLRVISCFVNTADGPSDISMNVALATGMLFDRKHWGVRIGGVGMDMRFALVYDLSCHLFPDGFDCIGKDMRCPASDHSNDRGEENYSPDRHHAEGSYALRYRSL